MGRRRGGAWVVHVDSRRANETPHMWLPTYVYLRRFRRTTPLAIPRIKSQVRLRGTAHLTGRAEIHLEYHVALYLA
jgi:hypothetical protein